MSERTCRKDLRAGLLKRPRPAGRRVVERWWPDWDSERLLWNLVLVSQARKAEGGGVGYVVQSSTGGVETIHNFRILSHVLVQPSATLRTTIKA